ncbi:NAD-dependent protein deacylase Sirt4 [Culicoides brevitarsis]|uniref:NAD-dependent protein deacylase Sirt4 n=1 Tax=Culicoides brevitarsis TaxID=469753 RepID=UPI00307BBF5B
MRVIPFLRFRLTPHRAIDQNLFVPKHEPATEEQIKSLQDFLIDKPNTLVLTGAGISTESGIPDYRSDGVGLYARSNHKPVQHQEFLKSADIRKRYWARNFIGWESFSRKEPNATHYALARFEREARISGIVTQNVDRLHTKAGSKNVTELHGSGYEVGCLSCSYEIDRHEFQVILKQRNPDVSTPEIMANMVRPDGDVDLPQEIIDNFHVPPCPSCKNGFLKPKIVFFGDNVPSDRILKLIQLITTSDAVLVLGSSLSVYSGFRIVLQAKELGIPVAMVNIGTTRGDKHADVRIHAKCGDVIPHLFKFK